MLDLEIVAVKCLDCEQMVWAGDDHPCWVEELGMRALEEAMWKKYQAEDAIEEVDEDERLERMPYIWQEQQSDQNYWAQCAAEGYNPSRDHSPTCNCPECCGDEPDEMGPEAQQAMNAFHLQESEGTWQDQERQADFERIAYCGWEEF